MTKITSAMIYSVNLSWCLGAVETGLAGSNSSSSSARARSVARRDPCSTLPDQHHLPCTVTPLTYHRGVGHPQNRSLDRDASE